MKPRIFTRRNLVRLVFALLAMATLLMIFHRVEAWRGRRAWDVYRKSAEARGVQLWLRDFVTPPIPDAENFAAIPYFTGRFGSAAEKKAAEELLPALNQPGLERPTSGNSLDGKPVKLAEWRDYFVKSKVIAAPGDDPARDLIAMLEKVPGLQQIRAAAARPKARYPIDIEKGFAMEMPHLGAIQAAAGLFSLEAEARIAIGDGAGALDAIKYNFRLADSIRDDPTLLAFLVRVAVLERAVASIHSGITHNVWNDGQLSAFEQSLAGQKLIPSLRFAFAVERAAMTTELERLASNSAYNSSAIWETVGTTPLISYTFPRGWFYLNMIKANEIHDRILARFSPVNGIEPEFIGSGELSLEKEIEGFSGLDRFRYVFVQLIMPALGSVETAMLFSQTRINQARISIALERAALASGEYPEALALLTSFMIPKDPCDGQPMRFRRLEKGYELWSVAKDRVDANGRTDASITSPRNQPDWLWKVVKSPAAVKP